MTEGRIMKRERDSLGKTEVETVKVSERDFTPSGCDAITLKGYQLGSVCSSVLYHQR